MATVTVEREVETGSGWEHRVRVVGANGASMHVVRLGFSDYEHWCRGAVAPGVMSARVVEVLLGAVGGAGSRVPEPLPEVIEAGLVRRWVRGADGLLGG